MDWWPTGIGKTELEREVMRRLTMRLEQQIDWRMIHGPGREEFEHQYAKQRANKRRRVRSKR